MIKFFRSLTDVAVDETTEKTSKFIEWFKVEWLGLSRFFWLFLTLILVLILSVLIIECCKMKKHDGGYEKPRYRGRQFAFFIMLGIMCLGLAPKVSAANVVVGNTTFKPIELGDDIGGKYLWFQEGTYNLKNDWINGGNIEAVSTTVLSVLNHSLGTDIHMFGNQDNDFILTIEVFGSTAKITPSSNVPIFFESGAGVITDLGFLEDIDGDVLYIETTNSLKPVINGEIAIVTSVDDPITLSRIKSSLTAFDNEDGDITSSIVLESDGYTVNKSTLGTYDVVYSVTDSSNNKTTITIKVMVADITAPTISGTDYYHTDSTVLTPISTIQSLLTISDNYDSIDDLTITVVEDTYSDNYSNFFDELFITFQVKDKSNNVSLHTITIYVDDTVGPVISGPTTIVKNTDELLTLNDIKSRYTIVDNKDGNKSIYDIEIVNDDYTGYADRKGEYEITFIVYDYARNFTYHTLTITVVDNIPPVIFVDNYYIQVSQLVAITNEEIVELLVASGQISKNTTQTISFLSNAYTNNEKNVGIYPVSLSVKSANGSEDVINVAVEVVAAEEDEDKIVVDEELSWFNQIGWWNLENWKVLLICVSGAVVVLVVLKLLFGKRRNYYYR